MPGFDQTGPTGAGPKTGLGYGECDKVTPQKKAPRYGLNLGRQRNFTYMNRISHAKTKNT